jgi:hypothetical protein
MPIEGLQDAFQADCRKSRVLVICDEHHHAAVAAIWRKTLLDPMVGEAYAYVQGESLKAWAALLVRLLNAWVTRMG